MGIPQIIVICVTFLAIGIEMSRHGEKRKGTYNVFISILGNAINLAILYWGGFFK